mmetsp:Transcript_18510/g.45430  ORF Transcript_18510/g.45430 Transcript_18510/m.45430 type:complete len:92 (-) Transcript_18510:481-756(-)
MLSNAQRRSAPAALCSIHLHTNLFKSTTASCSLERYTCTFPSKFIFRYCHRKFLNIVLQKKRFDFLFLHVPDHAIQKLLGIVFLQIFAFLQ